ncbi:MAG: hypothetical protein IPH88_03230 [Bacteroidales bacterium]|nr:hypothetical protein [Bacteroidales bacterium]
MKRFLFTVIILLGFLSLKAQIRGVTEFGESIMLYDDGTWEYISDSIETAEIPVNATPYFKSKASTFLYKSEKLNIGLYSDPAKWVLEEKNDADVAEFTFRMKNEDLYAMIINEKLDVSLENMREIALMNGRTVAPDLVLEAQEMRTVNGMQVLMLQMTGTIQGMKFKYYNYYYTSPEGATQFLTYCSENMFPTYKNDMEVLLNGLVVPK